MARWALVVWLGLAVAAAALLIPGVLSSSNRGLVFWGLVGLIVVTGVLAWLAMRGDRRTRRLLLLATGALTVLALIAASTVIALSVGQSPLVDVVGWPIAAAGATIALLGSIWSLRILPQAGT
jgi:hypothetical protein